jgi:predicted TIM-barrel fold metal-dependent hydrolase
MKLAVRIHAMFLPLVLLVASGAAMAQTGHLPIIDAHAHLNFTLVGRKQASMDFPGAVQGALARMDKFGFQRSIIMPQPSPPDSNNAWEIERLDFVAQQHADRIVRGGGGGTLNPMIQATAPDAVTDAVRAKFRALAQAVVDKGAVVLGEVTAHHLSMSAMGPQHGYESVPADHPLLLQLADISAETGVPIDFHFDLVPQDMTRENLPIFNDKTPMDLKGNMAAFERLLAHNPKAVIVWAHAGTDPLRTRTLDVQRELLRKYPNLVMSLRLAQTGPQQTTALGKNANFKPGWVGLLKEFPDRFVLGTDYFHGPQDSPSRGPEEAALANYQAALSALPPEIAEAVAYRNAVRIFRLQGM